MELFHLSSLIYIFWLSSHLKLSHFHSQDLDLLLALTVNTAQTLHCESISSSSTQSLANNQNQLFSLLLVNNISYDCFNPQCPHHLLLDTRQDLFWTVLSNSPKYEVQILVQQKSEFESDTDKTLWLEHVKCFSSMKSIHSKCQISITIPKVHQI